MRFVVDMNLSPDWVRHLEEAGHEAVHWSDVGQDDAPDPEIMAWAETDERIVLTGDLDFGTALARSRRDRPSVVQLRTRDTLPAQVGPTVLEAIRDAQGQLRSGALLTTGSRRSHLERLPFTD